MIALAAWLAAGVSACGGDRDAASRTGARQISGAELHRLDDRIYDETPRLGRVGVYVSGGGIDPARRCVQLSLYNPSQPNRVYMRQRFGPSVCIDSEPGGQPLFCSGPPDRRARPGDVVVPDVRALRLAEAQRRLDDLGLRSILECLSRESSGVDIDPQTPQSVSWVTHQCPVPGERVRTGTPVALEFTAQLPGGYRYRAGWLSSARAYGAGEGCRDGRDPGWP